MDQKEISKEKTSTDNKPNQMSSDLPKRQRRCKNQDADERNYICGCGKAYLSHPALYTHMKTKHNGIFPEGTVLPALDNGKIKPGPKNQAKQIGKILNKSNKGKLLQEDEDEFDAIDDFYIYLSELSLRQSKYYIQPVLCGTIDPCESFPVQIFTQLALDPAPLPSLIKQYYSQEIPIFEGQTSRVKPFPDLLAIFLLRIYKDITEHCFKEVSVLFVLLLNELKKHETELENEGGIFAAEKCVNIPIWCAKGMRDWIPGELEKVATKLRKNWGFRILGSGEQELKNSEFLIQCFMNWICNAGFSQQRITMVNTNLEEDGKNQSFEADEDNNQHNNEIRDLNVPMNLKEEASVEFQPVQQNELNGGASLKGNVENYPQQQCVQSLLFFK